MSKPNEQHQFDLLYVSHIVFEENTFENILPDVDIGSRYKVARALKMKKKSEIAFLLKAIYKKVGVFEYPKVFQCDKGSKSKSDVTELC